MQEAVLLVHEVHLGRARHKGALGMAAEAAAFEFWDVILPAWQQHQVAVCKAIYHSWYMQTLTVRSSFFLQRKYRKSSAVRPFCTSMAARKHTA